MSKKLTHEFIAMRTKCDRLESIKNLNLWGNDLDDISIIRTMHNLEVVSLSVNKIRTLRDFSNLRNLRELYLRKNSISDINEVNYLTNLPNLKILWLSENPVAEVKNYRNIVIRTLPQITKLDDNVISPEERDSAEEGNNAGGNYNEESLEQEPSYDNQIEENVFESKKFNYDFKNEKENFSGLNEYKLNENRENKVGYNEIYSNNERNRKLRDKFNYQKEQNDVADKNFNHNLVKKVSANYEDTSQLAKDFEVMNLANANKRNSSQDNINYKQKNQFSNVQQNSRKDPTPTYNNNLQGINSSRGGNIVNCVLMLLKELNDSELEMVRADIERKLSKY